MKENNNSYDNTYFATMEQIVLDNIDSCTVCDYLDQFPEEKREYEYFKYVISNYIKFMFIDKAKSLGKSCSEEIYYNTEIDICLPDFVNEIYSNSSFNNLNEFAAEDAWMKNDPEFKPIWVGADRYLGTRDIDFDDMDSLVAEFTDDSVYEGGLEGAENLKTSYMNFVIDSFIKEMIVRDCGELMSSHYHWDHYADIISFTNVYISKFPPCINEIYPLEWVEDYFQVNHC